MTPWNREVESMGPVMALDMQSLLYKQHHLAVPAVLEDRLDRRVWSGAQEAQLKSFKREGFFQAGAKPAAEVTVFVGRNRVPYCVAPESLRGSSYFAALIEKRAAEGNLWPQIAVDCDETIFQQMLALLRYNSFDALPKLSDPEMFRLRQELAFYGIEVAEPAAAVKKPSSPPRPPSNPGCGGSSPTQLHEHQTIAHFSLAELPDLPEELCSSGMLVLVARLARGADDDRGRCSCTPRDQPTFWALSFHYRHTFCTGCGNPPPPSVSPRFIAEMYMAAAMYYSGEQAAPSKWSVGRDSTCTLKVFHGRTGCVCRCCGSAQWAVSTYHSHAFCVHCGTSAVEQTLVSILLSLRFGGVHRSPKARREDPALESCRKAEVSPRETLRFHPVPLTKGPSKP